MIQQLDHGRSDAATLEQLFNHDISIQTTPHQPAPSKTALSKYLLLYLQGGKDLEGVPWQRGEMGGAILSEDLSVIKHLGPVFQPDRDDYWRSSRLLAGSLRLVNENSLYFFYGGSPDRPNLLHEYIGFCKGIIRDNHEIDWQAPQLIEFLDWEKYYDYSDHPLMPDQRHRQLRDPFPIFHEGKYWMFLSAAAKTNSQPKKGCIGLAVADQLEGPYTLLPPALFPHFMTDEGEQGLFYECERSHVYYKGGMWHMFFSVMKQHVDPRWLEQLGDDAASITDSSLYHFVSPQINGPYQPAGVVPVVKGSSESNLYAINFEHNNQQELIAYGLNLGMEELDVSGQWKVLWDNDYPEMKKVSPSGQQGVADPSSLLYGREGYFIWDAILFKLPA
ncbi:glycoside hydrolase family 68 protein [Moorena bouillonii]|uniref:Glycoside hydrolase family 68 protein n=1 Tax=Moorena bouillonii PNG TaxID=568701 RepID=A0A1U7N5R8_9CYAN|nr:glycoside hydrolase family 68 protein [Moorena bouillonii]OLT61266.1 hypothetical protein BJP37_21835 [Moorena bouillonii PNG]